MPPIPQNSPLLWTRGVAARETLSYLDRRGIDAEPALFGAGLSRRQLSENDIGVSVASQHRFLERAATEANDNLLGLHVAAEMDMRAIGILFYLGSSSPTVSKRSKTWRITALPLMNRSSSRSFGTRMRYYWLSAMRRNSTSRTSSFSNSSHSGSFARCTSRRTWISPRCA